MPVLGALSDRVGRRAVLLGSFAVDLACLASLACAREAWWIAAGAVMGCCDGAWAAPRDRRRPVRAAGARAGGAADALRRAPVPPHDDAARARGGGARGGREAADGGGGDRGARATATTTRRPALAAGFAYLYVLSMVGIMSGLVLGYASMRWIGTRFAMATCGLSCLPALLYGAARRACRTCRRP